MTLPATFLRDAQQLIPAERRFDDPLSTLAFGTDASFYRLIPQLVIRVESEDEVVGLLKLAPRNKVPVNFARPALAWAPITPGCRRICVPCPRISRAFQLSPRTINTESLIAWPDRLVPAARKVTGT